MGFRIRRFAGLRLRQGRIELDLRWWAWGLDGTLSGRTTGLLALIETPEALEVFLLRAQGQDDAKRRAQRCITAVQEASRLVAARGWLV
jgi:hypothetical protein